VGDFAAGPLNGLRYHQVMPDARSKTLEKPQRRSVRCTSFAGTAPRGRVVRGLEEDDGHGWTTLAIDRNTREWSIAQRHNQSDAAKAAYGNLYSAE